MSTILRKYAVATAAGTHIRIPMIVAGATDFAAGGDWTPVAADTKISKDGGTQANLATAPTYTNGAWNFELSAAELTCKHLEIMVVDAATKAVEDQAILVETYGDVLAQHFTEAMSAGIVQATAVTGTLSPTQMTTSLTEVTDDHYNGRTLIWLSGALAGQATDITDYAGSNKMLTFTGVTDTPADTDIFIIV
jgi:hypothetical protein